MHLVACPIPEEPLEDAPQSALLSDLTEGERWEGFWSADVYYVRCTRCTGAVEWFKLSDDEPSVRDVIDPVGVRGSKPATRVLEFPIRRMQTRAVVASGPDGRGMLVGTVRRQARPRSAARRAGE